MRPHRTRHRLAVVGLAGLAIAGVLSACQQIGTDPEVPAAIELAPFPSPAVVVGDTLRNLAGAVAGVQAIVRNVAGDVIDKAPVRYLYADYNRDSALLVDSLTGRVVARKAITSEARIAARIGSSLQVLRPIQLTLRPDSVERSGTPPLMTTTFPDTGRTVNTTAELAVTVRNIQGTTANPVNGWVVRFELVRPVNAANDTTGAAYLVDDRGRASVLDTTDYSGLAGRKVRVRAGRFPTTGTDTVEVRAVVSYRGQVLRGAPVRLIAPVRRGAG